jgi:hypothetical protein
MWHHVAMTIGVGKRPRDAAQLAKWIVDQATEHGAKPADTKNAAAVALGRLGGLKGGKARADKLSARKRSAIAKKAAAARWGTKSTS